MVDYSVELCDAFVLKLRSTYSDFDLIHMWRYFVYGHAARPIWRGEACVVFEEIDWKWQQFSLWNRQKILYDLALFVGRIAIEAASKVAQQARVCEPL